MKEYILKPIMTRPTVTLTPASDKPAMVKIIPPRQPLPTAVIDPGKPMFKLGLDVHLQSIMAVAQKDHAHPHAPRKFTRDQLVVQVRQWVAEGFQVFCVQESCGFGFVLHRELVAAGAQSFLITPIALNGQRKTDKLDARALCLRLSRWLDGNRDELAPIRIPSETEQRQREGTRRRKFLAGAIRSLANRGHSQVSEYCHAQLPHRWWGPRNWRKLATLDPWVLGVLARLRDLIVAIEAQLAQLEAELLARVKDQVTPKGLGDMTLVIAARPVAPAAFGMRLQRRAGGSTGFGKGNLFRYSRLSTLIWTDVLELDIEGKADGLEAEGRGREDAAGPGLFISHKTPVFCFGTTVF